MQTGSKPSAASVEKNPLAPIVAADPSRPFVIAQLGQSLDGRIATLSGESRWINGEAALDHLHRLRAAVDAVVVGVGTAIADDPRLTVRRVEGVSPARVVIDPNRRLPASAQCLSGLDGVRRVLVQTCGSPTNGDIETVDIARVDGQLPPLSIVSALFARGLRRLLIEGGAATVSAFIDAGVVDRLHVLVAPVILGSGKSGLALKPVTILRHALRPPTGVHVLGDGNVLFDCDLRG